ncbi:transmembrane protein, putative [Bodo saltans]|uniref:Transmembrane protein, putative n=1 Tax=Bodo saltans TaxID=75058 RepID=A0A0S4JHB3_BODSA|nr:transmembrane protein, putative [Bodo saltans]|eukprot:CUG90874.1 transmembrane protein, putative [Bodo saltans]
MSPMPISSAASSVSVKSSVVINVQPLNRRQLIDNPIALILNVTVASPFASYWSLANVTLNGQPLKWESVAAVTGSWHLVTLQPPISGGWVGAGLSLAYSDQVLRIVITLACGSSPFLEMLVNVNSPGLSRAFAQQVTTTIQSSQIVSLLSGSPSSAPALARTMAIRSMVMCDADAAVSRGVIDLDFSLCTADSAASVSARSAIISNFVVVGAVGVLLTFISFSWAFLRNESVLKAAVIMALPSSLLPILTIVIPSTTSSIVFLGTRLSSSTCRGIDTSLMVAGLLLPIAPVVGVLWVWLVKAHGSDAKWLCTHRPTTVSPPPAPTHLAGKLRSFALSGVERRWKWQPSAAALSSEGTPSSAQVLLLEYRLLWYYCLDNVLLCVVTALSIASGLDQGNLILCQVATGAVVALLVVQLIVCLIARPFTSLLAHVATILNLALTFLSVGAQLIVAASTSPSLLWLVDASLICILGAVGVSLCKVVADVHALFVGIRRRWIRLRNADKNQNDLMLSNMLRGTTDEDQEALHVVSDVDAGKQLPTTKDDVALVGSEAKACDFFDARDIEDIAVELQFWSATGTAFGTGHNTEDTLSILSPDFHLQPLGFTHEDGWNIQATPKVTCLSRV